MAKDKTRTRELPKWLEQRTSVTVRNVPASAGYYGIDSKFLAWHDVYGRFRQGARVRA